MPLWKNRKVASRGTWAQEPARALQGFRPTTVDYVAHRLTNHMGLCITTGCEQERKDEPIAPTHMALSAIVRGRRISDHKAAKPKTETVEI